jgi:hypothetical protein
MELVHILGRGAKFTHVLTPPGYFHPAIGLSTQQRSMNSLRSNSLPLNLLLMTSRQHAQELAPCKLRGLGCWYR